MPYLMFRSGLAAWKQSQIDSSAVKITDGVWLYDKKTEDHWPDVLSVKVMQCALQDLEAIIAPDLEEKLKYVESRIIKRNLQGRAIRRLTRMLHTVIGLSLDFDTVGHAKDLLFALNEGVLPGEAPAETTSPRDNPLGFDRDSVKKYLLSVAKKEPIH